MFLKALQRDDPGSSRWLDGVMQRIRSMSRRMGSNPDMLAVHVWDLYAKASPLLGLWVVLKDKELVGHSVGFIETYDWRLVGWISQVEMDYPATTEFKDHYLDAIENWVHNVNELYKSQGVKVTELMMSSPRLNDPWPRHAGFFPYRTVFRKEVR